MRLLALTAAFTLAGVATGYADPIPLDDAQMDVVTAGANDSQWTLEWSGVRPDYSVMTFENGVTISVSGSFPETTGWTVTVSTSTVGG